MLRSASINLEDSYALLKINGVSIVLMQDTSMLINDVFKFQLPREWLEHEAKRNRYVLGDFFGGMWYLELSKTSDCFQKRVLKSMLLSAGECNGVSYFDKTFLPVNTRSIEELEIWLGMIDT